MTSSCHTFSYYPLTQLERVEKEADNQEHLLKERINRLETTRIELEEELGRSRNHVAEERLRAEEHVMQVRAKVKVEQEERVHALEEKVRTLQAGRDEMTSHAAQQAHSVGDLQTKNANLSIDNEALRRRIDDLNQVSVCW